MPPPPWGEEVDFNLVQHPGAVHRVPAHELQQQSGRDAHSIEADARFVDPARGDYRVRDDSPALALGFVNFPMDRFGVQKPGLKALARRPVLPPVDGRGAPPPARDVTPVTWLGARVRNIADEGEMSAFGLSGVTGVLVLAVAPGSGLANLGLRENDVVLSVDDFPISDTTALLRRAPAWPTTRLMTVRIARDQSPLQLSLTPFLHP